jgi:hypothetical protein
MKIKLIILTFLMLTFYSLNAQDKKDIFIPEQYEEHRIDTILDSKIKLRVIIIRKTIMDKAVPVNYSNENNKTETQYYRDYSSEIIVYNANEILFKRTFIKNDFEQIGDDEFMNKAITHNTWIKEYDRKNKMIKISHVIGVPETDWNYHFTIFIDKKGNFRSELDEIE